MMRRRTDPKDISHHEQAAGARPHYRQRILPERSATRTARCGRGWREKDLRHCLRTAETFHTEQIVSALMRQLGWPCSIIAGFCTIGVVRRDIPGRYTSAGAVGLYRQRRRGALTQSRQDAKGKIMNGILCAFAPLREIILEARIAENVAKLLEDEL